MDLNLINMFNQEIEIFRIIPYNKGTYETMEIVKGRNLITKGNLLRTIIREEERTDGGKIIIEEEYRYIHIIDMIDEGKGHTNFYIVDRHIYAAYKSGLVDVIKTSNTYSAKLSLYSKVKIKTGMGVYWFQNPMFIPWLLTSIIAVGSIILGFINKACE